jgi:DNA-binding CsgD family transcriptional regulator
MELLERTEQLSTLERELERSREGGRLAIISGEAGAGKSALARAFIAQHTRDADVLVGQCDDLFAPRPLGPLADIARGRPGALTNALAAGDEAAAFDAFLSELAAPSRPVIVLLEDLQWADEATLDLLRFTARRLDVLSCLLLVTHRDDLAADHPLRRAAGSFVGSSVTRVHVPPLSVDAVRELLGDRGAEAESFHERTGGNPFFVVEALHCEPGALPETVRDAILAKTVGLSAPARDALDAAAVLGHTYARLIEIVAECSSEAVDECVAAGLLVDDGQRQSFRHDLGRQAIEDAMTPLRRRHLHARALAALGDDSDVVQRAHHAIAAGEPAAIVELASRAGDHCVALGAHSQAASLYGSALEHTPDDDLDRRLELLQGRATTSFVAERIDDAITAGEQLVRLVTDETDRGHWEAWLADAYWTAGRKQEAWTTLRVTIARLEPQGPSRNLADALFKLACHHMVSGEFDEGIEQSRLSVEMSELVGAEETALAARGVEGVCLSCNGDESGIELLHDVMDGAKRAGHPIEVCRVGNNLAGQYVSYVRPTRAIDVLNEIIEVADENDFPSRRNCMITARAEAFVMLDRWDEAVADSRAILAQPDLVEANRGYALWHIGRVRARRGDPSPFEILDEALDSAVTLDEAQFIAPFLITRTEAAWLSGDDDRARRELTRAIAYADRLERCHLRDLAFWSRRLGVPWTPPDHVRDDPIPAILEDDFRAIAAFWRSRGCHYEAANALVDSDDIDGLREAHQQLTTMGARPLALRVARRLRDLGAREVPRGPRATTRANSAGLTARELEVAALLARGMTNPEIAHELVLSAKTVEHHVSAVLAKLGVRNRRQVARAADEIGLALNLS